MTHNIEDCSIQIFKTGSYRYLFWYNINEIIIFSYSANLFRQLHNVLKLSQKVSFRIHNRGILVIKMIIKIEDELLFLTITVNCIEGLNYTFKY